MEAVCPSETLVCLYACNSTQRYSPEDQYGHLYRSENLVSHYARSVKLSFLEQRTKYVPKPPHCLEDSCPPRKVGSRQLTINF